MVDRLLDAVGLHPSLVGRVLRRGQRPLALDADVEDRVQHAVDDRRRALGLGVGLLEGGPRSSLLRVLVVPEAENPHVVTSRRRSRAIGPANPRGAIGNPQHANVTVGRRVPRREPPNKAVCVGRRTHPRRRRRVG